MEKNNLKIVRFYTVRENTSPVLTSGWKEKYSSRCAGWHNGWGYEIHTLKKPYVSVKLEDGHWYKIHQLLGENRCSAKTSERLMKENLSRWIDKPLSEMLEYLKKELVTC